MKLRAALATALLAVACAKPEPVPPQYQPAASVLEVVATLRRHLMDDTYRFEPARDGALFPHLYEPMPVTAVQWIAPLTKNAEGEFETGKIERKNRP